MICAFATRLRPLLRNFAGKIRFCREFGEVQNNQGVARRIIPAIRWQIVALQVSLWRARRGDDVEAGVNKH